MLKIIYRSMLKELLVISVLILAFLNSIIMMEKILKLTRLLSGIGTSAGDMARLILYLQPQMLILTIPMAILLAPIIVYGRMTMDNEIVILKSSGMSFRHISYPVIVLAVAGFVMSSFFSFYLAPRGSQKLKQEVARMVAVKAALAIEAGTFNTSVKDLVILVRGKQKDLLQDIFIYDNRSKDEPKVLMASEGRLIMEDDFTLRLSLKDGYINVIKEPNIIELFFDRYQFSMTLQPVAPLLKNFELMPDELLRRMQAANQKKDRLSLFLELQRRISLPVVCLVLILLAAPLSLVAGKSGKLLGLATGMAVMLAYYMFHIYCEDLAMNSKIPPFAGAWASTVLLTIIGMLLYRRENNR